MLITIKTEISLHGIKILITHTVDIICVKNMSKVCFPHYEEIIFLNNVGTINPQVSTMLMLLTFYVYKS